MGYPASGSGAVGNKGVLPCGLFMRPAASLELCRAEYGYPSDAHRAAEQTGWCTVQVPVAQQFQTT